MVDEQQLEKWRVTTAHLEKAREFLPEKPIENRGETPDLDLASLESYLSFLEHNELELAMDELEGIGQLNDCPADFWKHLKLAADNMGLYVCAERYHSEFTAKCSRDAKSRS